MDRCGNPGRDQVELFVFNREQHTILMSLSLAYGRLRTGERSL